LDLLAGIKGCSKETRAVLDSIKEQVLHSDFDEAGSAAAAYMDELSSVNSETRAGNQIKPRFQNREIAGLDIAKGLELYEGDEETYAVVLRVYAKDVRSMLSSIETAGRNKLDEYGRAVHSIKGMSRGIFAEAAGNDAALLEKAAKNGDLNYINEHNGAFLETVRKLVFELESTLSTIDAENPKPKKNKPDAELLVKLVSACRAYSMDGVDAAMEEIEKYEYTADEGLAVWLRESIDRGGFIKIAEKLSDSQRMLSA
jgi:HPt (histidine-containing phosphotransfer) domain-containing protein